MGKQHEANLQSSIWRAAALNDMKTFLQKITKPIPLIVLQMGRNDCLTSDDFTGVFCIR